MFVIKNWQFILIGALILIAGGLFSINRIQAVTLDKVQSELTVARQKVKDMEEAKKLVDAALLARDAALAASRVELEKSRSVTNAGRNTQDDRDLSPYMQRFVDSLPE